MLRSRLLTRIAPVGGADVHGFLSRMLKIYTPSGRGAVTCTRRKRRPRRNVHANPPLGPLAQPAARAQERAPNTAGKRSNEQCATGADHGFHLARGEDRHLPPGRGLDEDHDLLHVRLPVRHQRPPQGRAHPLHRGQSRPSGEPRRAVRQGLGRDHEPVFPGQADQAAAADRRAGHREFPRDRVGGGAGPRHRMARPGPRDRPASASPSSPGATRARASPAGGASSSAPRISPPMAGSARSTWPPPGSTRWAAASGSSAIRTGSGPNTC